MPSQFKISIDISFNSDKEMYEMEEVIYNACQLIFDNFENIIVDITRDSTISIDGYQRTTTDHSIKYVNIDENKYDF